MGDNPKINDSESVFAELTKLVPESNRLVVISAYIKQSAYDLLAKLIPGHCTALFVGRFIPSDFISGASDFSVLEDCLARGFRVLMLDNLHAKIYQVDQEVMYVGSANCTNNGFSIVGQGNMEALVRLKPDEQTNAFTQTIIESSIEISQTVCSLMRKHLQSIEDIAGVEQHVVGGWPEEIASIRKALLVSDFPCAHPDEWHPIYNEQPNLPFARIRSCGNLDEQKEHFKKSKAFKWLIETLSSKPNSMARFGELSADLHNALSDDPAPYRSSVKEILAYMYEYIGKYATDRIIITVPGRRSQVMQLINEGQS